MEPINPNSLRARLQTIIERGERSSREAIRNNGGQIPDVVPEERILTPDEQAILDLTRILKDTEDIRE